MEQFSDKFNWLGRRIASYFFQGLFLIAPASFTVYVIYVVFTFLNDQTKPVFAHLFHFNFPGLGIIIFATFITIVGFVGSTVLVQPILNIVENLLEHTPLVKDIYSSFKDFIGAFISNKRKFNKPVIVEMGKGVGIFRLGFITDDDLTEFHIADKVAVYIPMSYTFTGQLFIVNKDQVSPLPSTKSSDLIKYILSGGVTEVEDKGSKG